MPYILKDRAEKLTNNPQLMKDPGDWNWAYTQEYVRIWTAKPSYATFHLISKTIDRPESEPGVWQLTGSLKVFVGATDLMVARREAVAEFRRRVIAPYEAAKLKDKANTDPYADLFEEK